MKPILFTKTATTFNTNGLGRLDALSCIVTEEKNGAYELEMEIAETAEHASQIEMSSIIVAKPSQGGSNQPFRVYKITKPINGRFTVYAQHISYQLSYIPCMPFTIAASSSACNATLQALKTNAAEACPFTFWTDVVKVAGYNQVVPASIRSRLGGVQGSVLDQFGGEYEWNGYTVKLWQNRGLTVPAVTLRYGKNITDLNQEENIESTITGIVPYWVSSEGDITVTLPEKSVDSQYAGSYPFKRTVPYDFSQDFETPPSQAQMRAKAQAYVNSSGIGIPKVSIKVSFVNLSDTEDYKDVAALQQVNLCDMVGVYFEKLNISTTAKVVKTEYDVLKEKYASVEIGSLRSSLAGTISDTTGAISAVANNTRNMFKSYTNTVNDLIDNATSWLTSAGGYVIAVKNQDGSWKELLFMSTNDITDVHANVLRVNENGLGFSSTGVAGPYTQAWTLDGKLVIGGTNVPSLTVYDNQNHILFQIDKNGMEWTATYSSMTKNGTFTAQNANLTNATIKGGSLTVVQNVGGTEVELFKVSNTGKLTVKSTAGATLFEADKDGMEWTATNSSMTKTGNLTAKNANLTNATINGGSLTVTQNVGGTDVEIFKVSADGKLKVQTTAGASVFEAAPDGVSWNEEGLEGNVRYSSSMTKKGHLTASHATFNDAEINGGSFSVKDSQQNEVFKIDSSGKLDVKKSDGTVILEADKNGIMWNESGQVSGQNKSSSMTKEGFLTALGALLQNATIQGGSLYQENNDRYLELLNGVIHGGPIGTDFYIYFAYNVIDRGSTIACIALDSDGLMLDTSNIFIRDYRGGTVYKGAENISVLTEPPQFDTAQVLDIDGNPIDVVIGWKPNTGSYKDVVHGIIKE